MSGRTNNFKDITTLRDNFTEARLSMTKSLATSGVTRKASLRDDKILKIKHLMTSNSFLRIVERTNGNQMRNQLVMIYWYHLSIYLTIN